MQSAHSHTAYLKNLYFVVFVAAGFISPFSVIFYKHVLITPDGQTADHLIGWIFFFMPLIALITNVPVGIITDRLHIGRHLITICCFGSALFAFLTGLGGIETAMTHSLHYRFMWIFIMMMFYAIFFSPMIPMLDADTMKLLNAHCRRENYGRIRVWGTFGWSVSCIGMGVILHTFYHLPILFYCAAIVFVVMGLISLRGLRSWKRPIPVRIPWDHLRKDRMFSRFLLFSLLNGILFISSFLYTSYFLDDVLTNPLEIGIIFGTWTLFEIPIMFYGRPLIRVLGNRWLILIGLLINGIRLILFSLFTLETPFFWKWAAATLQGAAFGAIHIGTIDLVDRQSHGDMRATYVHISNVARTAIASAIGGKLGALIISTHGADILMRTTGIGSIMLIFYFALLVRGHGPESADQQN